MKLFVKAGKIQNHTQTIAKQKSEKTQKQNTKTKRKQSDSHVIVSSQACFLTIEKGKETKFNVALYNYQSQINNPAVLAIVSTSKGTSAQIIEKKDQLLLFNDFGKVCKNIHNYIFVLFCCFFCTLILKFNLKQNIRKHTNNKQKHTKITQK